MKNLVGKRIAILVENDYEDQELWYPLYRLREAGAEVVVIGPRTGTYHSKHGYPVEATLAAAEANPADFDGVVVPGGWAPDRLRRYAAITGLVKALDDAGKVVAAICHGPHVLISAGVVRGRRVAAVIALKDDLINAGATYVDAEAVRDGNLISARVPDDLPAFMRQVLTALAAPVEKLSAQDVLRLAIEKERESYELYDLAAQRSTNLETKALFRRLANEEAGHRGALEADLEQLTSDPVWDRYDGWREVA